MTQTPAPLPPTPNQRLVFAVESVLIILMFEALAIFVFATDWWSRRSRRSRGFQTAQAWG